jgi:UDP-glucose 4-epimerase
LRILVTGGAGFIGSHLTDRLLDRSDEVLVIDNYATGRRDNLPASAPGLTVVEGDIADGDLVDRTFRTFGPEVVVHAAASYKDPGDWVSDVRTNVLGSVNVTRATGIVGARRLIYLQTAL